VPVPRTIAGRGGKTTPVFVGGEVGSVFHGHTVAFG
jgi:hypothetical protein